MPLLDTKAALLSVATILVSTVVPREGLASPENVIWVNPVNVTVSANSLEKTAGCQGCQDAAAISEQQITSGDGYLEFRVSETTENRQIGLSNGDSDTTGSDIDFGIHLWLDGGFSVYENGVWKAGGNYSTDDIFRIAVESGVVNFRQNGNFIYESGVTPTLPLLVDTSLWTLGATISDAVISFAGSGGGGPGVTWTNLANVVANQNALEKTGGCEGCQDAGAVSVEQIVSGDGYVEFTATETTTNRQIGLSNGDTDTTGSDIDFGIHLWLDGGFSVYENGVWKASGQYVTGDVFRIAVESGVVSFRQNGNLIHTSTTAPTLPLLVDTSLWTLGATINDVVMPSGGGVPPSSCGISDNLAHPPPNYDSDIRPAKGQSFTDPVFGCSIKRISDGVAEFGMPARNEHSAMPPFNSDNTRLLLQDCCSYYVTDLDGNVVVPP